MRCAPPFPSTDLPTKQHLDDRLAVVRSDVLAAIKDQSERTITWTVIAVFGAITATGGAIAGIAALSGRRLLEFQTINAVHMGRR